MSGSTGWGKPAVATALIVTAMKNAYNDANPSDDVANTFVPEIVAQLTALHNGLADDLIALSGAFASARELAWHIRNFG